MLACVPKQKLPLIKTKNTKREVNSSEKEGGNMMGQFRTKKRRVV